MEFVSCDIPPPPMWHEPAKSSSCPFFASSPTSSSPPNFLHQDHPNFLQDPFFTVRMDKSVTQYQLDRMCQRFHSPPPPPFASGREIRGQLRKPRKGKGRAGDLKHLGGPRDLVIKRVTLQTGKGLQREGIRDELLE